MPLSQPQDRELLHSRDIVLRGYRAVPSRLAELLPWNWQPPATQSVAA